MHGRTPLHYAVKIGSLLSAKLVLTQLPSVLDVPDLSGWTALDMVSGLQV
jgi:ankyrin repeat protein